MINMTICSCSGKVSSSHLLLHHYVKYLYGLRLDIKLFKSGISFGYEYFYLLYIHTVHDQHHNLFLFGQIIQPPASTTLCRICVWAADRYPSENNDNIKQSTCSLVSSFVLSVQILKIICSI